MNEAKQKLQLQPRRKSNLKQKAKRVFKNGYFVFENNVASIATEKERIDFYGNKIEKNGKHHIFLDLGATKVIEVSNWKEYNFKETNGKTKSKKCQIF